jgi:ParB/Sulfiredoxin domain
MFKGTIHETSNYKTFEMSTFNRDVSNTQALEKSMLQHGFLSAYPLHVEKREDGRLYIMDGHHRLTVARRLKIPVKFIIETAKVDMHMLQKTTSKWTLEDYLTSYVRCEKPEYLKVEEFIDRTGLGLGISISLLRGNTATSANYNDKFKQGTYSISDQAFGENVAVVISTMYAAGVVFAKNRNLVAAVSKTLLTSQINSETLLTKIKKYSFLIENRSTVQQYLDVLEKLYNRGVKSKVPLAHYANESARARQSAFTKKGERAESC